MLSTKERRKLFEQYNPNQIRIGDRVTVSIHKKYPARVVGLTLDVKNRKVYADLKLLDAKPGDMLPTRVDVSDCYSTGALYRGHHTNG